MAHTLPPLPYDKTALEPHIDATTMEIHHGRHHNAYVTNLNAAIAGNAELEALSIEDLCKGIANVPEAIRNAVRNNGGGHFNHTLFWNIMGPNAGGAPTGKLAEAIDAAFGSFDDFKKAFAEAGVPAAMLFVRNQNGSHNPKEDMRMEDFAAACAVVTRWAVEMGQ
jgi:Fe-Mn family superoxide dismutase